MVGGQILSCPGCRHNSRSAALCEFGSHQVGGREKDSIGRGVGRIENSRMRKIFYAVQILLAMVLVAALARQGWMVPRDSSIRIENTFKASEQVTFSCPPGEIFLVNVTRGKTYDLKIPKQTQNLWCLFARKLDVNYWDCKGVIELQLTCRTGPVECDSHKPIHTLTFNELGVFVNHEHQRHAKWMPRFQDQGSAGKLDMVIKS